MTTALGMTWEAPASTYEPLPLDHRTVDYREVTRAIDAAAVKLAKIKEEVIRQRTEDRGQMAEGSLVA